MPARLAARRTAAFVGYVSIAVAFAWPLPLHLWTMLPGPVSGDTGVYVWNLWLFRHEIVAHHHFPFLTLEVLSLTPPVPLALHNYTTVANIIAFPLLPLLGTVATFNLLVILSPALAAYAAFVFARAAVRDDGAAWVAGVAFGFAPFMSARMQEHFSLLQTAPVVLFALALARLEGRPTWRMSAALGAAVGIAFLCDPYYAVYCLLIALFAIGYSAIVLRAPIVRPQRWGRAVLNVAIVCLAGLIAGIVIRGGGRFHWMGIHVSMTRLYTPVLIFTALVIARTWLWVRPHFQWAIPVLPPARVVFVAGIACVALVSPVLTAMGSRFGERQWISPPVLWRSSAPGLDLLALFVPNPLHPWWGGLFAPGLAAMPNGFVENVGSIPWVLIATLVVAVGWAGARLPRYWWAFTATFALLALGPFVHIAGVLTYVPTPWALLRYLPVIGAARMPPRLIVLVMLGLAMLLAHALRHLRTRVSRPGLVTAGVAVLLIAELLPAPRRLHSAAVPSIYGIVAADPRPIKVMTLPFGLRDGLSSFGNTTAAAQFYQTFHEKQIVGGYISRLPQRDLGEYRRMRVTRALMDLSEGESLTDERRASAITRAHELLRQWNLGYVVVETGRASDELVQFATEAFGLTFVASDGPYALYRTSLP
jgi:hypothetical protein